MILVAFIMSYWQSVLFRLSLSDTTLAYTNPILGSNFPFTLDYLLGNQNIMGARSYTTSEEKSQLKESRSPADCSWDYIYEKSSLMVRNITKYNSNIYS
jgi:hypothetical protein